MCSPRVMQHVQAALSGKVNRRNAIGTFGGAAVAGMTGSRAFAQATPVEATPVASSAGGVLDLTHTLTPKTPVWPGNESFAHEPVRTYAEHGFYGQALNFWEHTGTHYDAPAHFIEGNDTGEFLDPSKLVAPLVVIDISARAAEDADTGVSVEDIEAWESANGAIPQGAFVAMYSGWSLKIDDSEAFVNLDADGVMHYPGFMPAASELLLEQYGIVGVGVDTLSLDPGNSTDFGTHIAVLGSGNYGIEGLNNLEKAPAVGGTVVVGAAKHEAASGGHARVLVLT